MAKTKKIEQRGGLIQRPGIDADPVKPWQWATIPGRSDPVEIVSFPCPAPGHGAAIDDAATIMVRTTLGEPGTLLEVPFKHVACFAPDRHEWNARPRRYYDPQNPTAFVFSDAEPRRRLNIGHKNGGMVIDITHMGHETNRCGAYWFFKGRCEWNDGSHKRDPDHSYEFSPANLCYGDNSLPGAQDDLAKALDAINAYLERAGRWDAKASAWVPYYKHGLEEVRL